MNWSSRKNPRLKDYDYGQNGSYFFTACTFNRECIFSEAAVGQGLCPCRPSSVGTIVETEMRELSKKYLGVSIDKFVIMPNHIHAIVTIQRQGQSPCPTEPTSVDIMRELKSVTTKLANKADKTPGRKIWQFRFHDHVIRDNSEYQLIWQYIDLNPLNWQDDCFYCAEN